MLGTRSPEKRLYKSPATPNLARELHAQPGKLSHSHSRVQSMSASFQTLKLEEDLCSLYEESCKSAQNNSIIICQNIRRLEKVDDFFYIDVLVNDQIGLQALLDSGSMACTMNEGAEEELHKAGLLSESTQSNEDIVLVGCGGVKGGPSAFIS